jgi:predicted RNase H-like HicB family nuclease
MSEPLKVHATWDPEAQVWVAESDDIPGLITEAPTQQALIQKLADIIPVLLEENADWRALPEIPYSLMWETLQTVRLNRH